MLTQKSHCLAVTFQDRAGSIPGPWEGSRGRDAARGDLAESKAQGQGPRGALRGLAMLLTETAAQATAVPSAADLRLHLHNPRVLRGSARRAVPAQPPEGAGGRGGALPTSLLMKQ